MIAALRLESPWWLAALALLPWLAWWQASRGAAPAIAYPSRALLQAAVAARPRSPARWLRWLRWIALGLVILALARPQIEKSETRANARGINIVFALDFSGTMKTRDFLLDGRRVPRSEGLKRICAEFIEGRPNDRMGLVNFDRDAYLASPLTLDHEWLLERLKSERNGTGTAIGSALAVAAGHLQIHSNETRVVVLMTDAENISAGPPPDEVAEALRPLGVRIHCIQLVTPRPSWQMSDLAEYLTRVAVRTGGEFFRVSDGAGLRQVYAEIDKLEKQKLTDRRQTAWRELFPWLALPALALLLAELLLSQTVWRRLP